MRRDLARWFMLGTGIGFGIGFGIVTAVLMQ